MQIGRSQFFRAGCLYLLVLVPCCKALEILSGVRAYQWHIVFFSADPDLMTISAVRHSRNGKIAALIQQNQQISWYRFLVWVGLIAALPRDEPGSSYRRVDVSTSGSGVPGILNTPVTPGPRYRYSPRSRATALKSKRPYPWYLYSYRQRKPSSENNDEAEQQELLPPKKKKIKKGIKDWAGRVAQMKKLQETVEQNQGSWQQVKNFEKKLEDDQQFILKNALVYFGNALEKINQNANYPIPETVADFEQQLALVDPFLMIYTYSLVCLFSRISDHSERSEINRWQHSARYLMHYVMVDYNWPVELLEQWIDQTEPGLTSGLITLNMPAASYPQWSRVFCQTLGGFSPALLETDLDEYDQYSFLPSMIASLELRRFIDAFAQYGKEVLERESQHGDLMMLRSFQVLMMQILDTNGSMNPQEQSFIHAWLRLREIEGQHFTGWNTLFGLVEQPDSDQDYGVLVGLNPVQILDPGEF